MKNILESKFHKIKLVLTGSEEPNNGRMLHVADIYINDELKTYEYFGNWNRLDWNLENFILDSNDGEFVYIPAEGGGFLIDTTSLQKIELPNKTTSTASFLKNEFINKSLIK